MSKACWSHSKNHLIKFYSRAGILFIICLSFLSFSGLYATSFINLDKIQQLAQSHSGDTQKRFKAWAKLIESLKNKPVSAKLEGVNSFFNMFHYQDEGLSDDYWKSPDEFIIDGGGDCEDYAIIKYFTLATLGVSTDKLRITYVTSLNLNRAHMVLAYYSSPEAEPLILDSLENSIVKASLRPDLKPVYSFNGSGLWLAKQRGKEAAIGQPSSLGKWDELMKRMQ